MLELWVVSIVSSKTDDWFTIMQELPWPDELLMLYKEQGYSVIGQEKDMKLLAEGIQSWHTVADGPRLATEEDIQSMVKYYQPLPTQRKTREELLEWLEGAW